MKIPWTSKSVFGSVAATPSVPPSKICSWPISTIARLASLTAPGTTAFAVVVIGAGAADCRAGSRRARRDHGERNVDHRRRVSTAARSHCVEVVRDADLGSALELTGVVRAVGRVGSATCGDAGLTTDVGDARRDVHVGVIGRTRGTDHDGELDEPDRVRPGTVRVGRADGQ